MDKQNIIKFLKQNQIDDIEEIKYKEDIFTTRIYYDFDDSEIEAARAYANDECEDEEEGEVWYGEFFKPYLNDIVIDNVGDLLEDCMKEFNIEIQFITYDIDDQYEYSEVVAIFYDENKNINIENVIDDLKL
ncbi:hypothetical protein [Clostridium arbusti]|uniref:hypothetical protein n=1 Tax=Clostridium arbusti TaxID=1137848 RepID=UPI000287CC6E|nr:hypothetical protein [Clostridium arbusti]